MEYNTQRNALQMPEYGRMIQDMVEICKELPTKEERNEAALAIIEFMGQRNPNLNDEEYCKQKLWNHLFILANYELDIDAPYPLLSQEELSTKPRKMLYPSYDNEYKFYGKSIVQLIERAIQLEPGHEKDSLIQVIANNMKKSYNVYNKEHVQDDVILRHLRDLSNNRLDLTSLESLDKSKIYYNSNRKNNNNNNNQGKNNRYQNTNNNAKRRHQNTQITQKKQK